MYIDGINAERAGSAGFRTMVGRYSCRKRDRFWEIDFLRGVCVLLMVFDHFMYCLWDVMPDINNMLGTSLFSEWRRAAIRYWSWEVRVTVRMVVIFAFFILSGISCTLTRGNFRRCIPLALVAWGITEVTGVIDDNFIDGAHILFGVIHMIACGVFMYALLDNAVSAVVPLFGKGRRARKAENILRYFPGAVGVGFLIFFFVYCADLSFEGGAHFVSHIAADGDLSENLFRAVFVYLNDLNGFEFERYSADYFPLLPYAAAILAGGIIGRAYYHTAAKYTLMPLDGAWNKGFCFLGRHSAVIFVAHMVVIPVLMGLFALMTSIF